MRNFALPTGRAARERLQGARVLLLFSPDLCLGREPLEVLVAALPFVDLVQVRTKPAGALAPSPAPARESFEWCRRILDLARTARLAPFVLTVDDRVDVALALAHEGVAGVHLGQDDMPCADARALLGPEALIGLSTHDLEQVVLAEAEPVDYLGFGPVHATATKGYARGLGSEAAWIASSSSALPVFPIGGIGLSNAQELARVGRAAITSAILSAEDPARAARELRELLAGDD
ncbi:MAG: thiamine phosphate synthase [Planctomycetes bacterium]|nr:thiamine phosphate synthase [Planctomycetota bacterium]